LIQAQRGLLLRAYRIEKVSGIEDVVADKYSNKPRGNRSDPIW
jgi:hypothetical protein